MGRRGFISTLNAIAREAERSQRRRVAEARRDVAAIRRMERDQAKQLRETERLDKKFEKEQKQQYLESRLEETKDANDELDDTIGALKTILNHTLKINDRIDFEILKINEDFSPRPMPMELKAKLVSPREADFTRSVSKKGIFEKVLGIKRFEREIEIALGKYQDEIKKHLDEVSGRKAAIAEFENEVECAKLGFEAKKDQRNREVGELKQLYFELDRGSVITYYSMVLERSDYPDGFPQEFRVAYNPDSKELLVEYTLPELGIVPTASEYKYNKAKDSIEEKPRKKSEISELYRDIIAALTIRTLHELCEADQANAIDLITFNGFLETIDKSTGRDIRPCIISVRTTKLSFLEIKLDRIHLDACLRNLGAQVSSQPDALIAVKPIVEFNMVDKRFVEQDDLLSTMDGRPNLLDLSPSQFENLVSNLFQKMGLESKLTRASRDGGVDAVAYDSRPVLGGKVVIQAKRYKNTVGVSAIRDLYGTMMNEGANKGILVSTSGYGPDAYEFSKDKPIELIDGAGLLYLLDQVGIQARIFIPRIE